MKTVRSLYRELKHEKQQVEAASAPRDEGDLGAVVNVMIDGGHKLTRAAWLKPGDMTASVERRIQRECRNAKWEDRAKDEDILATVDLVDFSAAKVPREQAQQVCQGALDATPDPGPMTLRRFFSDWVPVLPPEKVRELQPLPPLPADGPQPAAAAAARASPAEPQQATPPQGPVAGTPQPPPSRVDRTHPDAAAPAALWGSSNGWDER